MIDEYEKKLIGLDKNNIFFLNFKIPLDDINLNEFIKKYDEIIKLEFINNGVIPIEFDITSDFIGNIDYNNVINHLIDNHNYEFEGDNNILKPYNDDEMGYILNNENSHGLNVITFLLKKNGIKLRIKIYNKMMTNFICSSLKGTFGTHYIDTIDQKASKRMKEVYTNEKFLKKRV